MKAKRGPKKSNNSNDYVISFRVNSKERDALLTQAENFGGNMSLLIREKLDMPDKKTRALQRKCDL